ncbi:hypothetical protein HRH59_06200 [Rheinheimera sp. YQF-2]|uniref:Uncharacterized protein n=1 Tax=Rheinheimera lutimaris TaxID=2740584 RepID=A0A7Y5APJ5_9GAMM|nr:hypothetical protein [Rheinheimera lutimaris]NRQ42158.1 hypothetical protein [Rheinheimera lutimaris]
MNKDLKLKIKSYPNVVATAIKSCWLFGNETVWDTKALQDNADYIYTRKLLGDTGWFVAEAVSKYIYVIKQMSLAVKARVEQPMLPHLNAYLLGSLNFLAHADTDLRAEVLGSIKLDLSKLNDAKAYYRAAHSKVLR